MKRDLVVIGGGGHTRVVLGMLEREGITPRGIITRDASLIGKAILGVPILGLEGDVALTPEKTILVNAVGNRVSAKGSGLCVRAAVYRRYHSQGFKFLDVVSSHAVCMPHVVIGNGIQLMPGAVLQTGAMIGENVLINTNASIDHDAILYPHCHIAPGAVICGDVVVGEETHVGAGAIIIQGIRLGCNVVIGAGAVITRNVPDGVVIKPAPGTQVKQSPL
jgi:sugar O-acyltransferase (sialic acid O-acetyltransferase NeuD family)